VGVYGSWNTSVGIATGYWLDCRGSISGKDKRFFSTPQRPDHLWSALNLQSSGYQVDISMSKAARIAVMDTITCETIGTEIENEEIYYKK
jgi:hypothetical protein